MVDSSLIPQSLLTLSHLIIIIIIIIIIRIRIKFFNVA